MAQQQPQVLIDLSTLPFSDGTGQPPAGAHYNQLPDADMLELLTREFNKNAALVQQWGTEIRFVENLPQGFSYWQYMTTSRKTPPVPSKPIKQTFGHPVMHHFSSGKQFLQHVAEIMDANELWIRTLIYHAQPNNQINWARSQVAQLINRPVICSNQH
ncbi:hypothetical protein QM012_008638 [Aureobasidium pullulans]|uniref:Uncharacterized protein n=1 Tax=Aureobasidium pullulans TaxID=5580 RepID=A0ABR0TLK8_AURPU